MLRLGVIGAALLAALTGCGDSAPKTYPVQGKVTLKGKGVTVCFTLDEARRAIRQVLIERTFGPAGSRVVVERALAGTEASVIAICDRTTALALPAGDYADRDAQEEAILSSLAAHAVEWVCLAGFMRLLSPRFVRAYPQRILNVHPSLLPAFAGLHAQRQALLHGVRVSGCTVHFVGEGLDDGPIVVQRAVTVRDEDDETSLAARILEQEHQAYAEALRRLLTEPWRVDGRRVLFGAGR